MDKRDALALAFGPNGRLASAHRDGAIRLWDVAAGKMTAVLQVPGSQGGVRCVAFSPDGRWLAAPVFEVNQWVLAIWDAATAKLEHVIRGRWPIPESISFSSDSELVAIAGAAHGVVEVWKPAARQRVASFEGIRAVFGAGGRLACVQRELAMRRRVYD